MSQPAGPAPKPSDQATTEHPLFGLQVFAGHNWVRIQVQFDRLPRLRWPLTAFVAAILIPGIERLFH